MVASNNHNKIAIRLFSVYEDKISEQSIALDTSDAIYDTVRRSINDLPKYGSLDILFYKDTNNQKYPNIKIVYKDNDGNYKSVDNKDTTKLLLSNLANSGFEFKSDNLSHFKKFNNDTLSDLEKNYTKKVNEIIGIRYKINEQKKLINKKYKEKKINERNESEDIKDNELGPLINTKNLLISQSKNLHDELSNLHSGLVDTKEKQSIFNKANTIYAISKDLSLKGVGNVFYEVDYLKSLDYYTKSYVKKSNLTKTSDNISKVRVFKNGVDIYGDFINGFIGIQVKNDLEGINDQSFIIADSEDRNITEHLQNIGFKNYKDIAILSIDKDSKAIIVQYYDDNGNIKEQIYDNWVDAILDKKVQLINKIWMTSSVAVAENLSNKMVTDLKMRGLGLKESDRFTGEDQRLKKPILDNIKILLNNDLRKFFTIPNIKDLDYKWVARWEQFKSAITWKENPNYINNWQKASQILLGVCTLGIQPLWYYNDNKDIREQNKSSNAPPEWLSKYHGKVYNKELANAFTFQGTQKNKEEIHKKIVDELASAMSDIKDSELEKLNVSSSVYALLVAREEFKNLSTAGQKAIRILVGYPLYVMISCPFRLLNFAFKSLSKVPVIGVIFKYANKPLEYLIRLSDNSDNNFFTEQLSNNEAVISKLGDKVLTRKFVNTLITASKEKIQSKIDSDISTQLSDLKIDDNAEISLLNPEYSDTKIEINEEKATFDPIDKLVDSLLYFKKADVDEKEFKKKLYDDFKSSVDMCKQKFLDINIADKEFSMSNSDEYADYVTGYLCDSLNNELQAYDQQRSALDMLNVDLEKLKNKENKSKEDIKKIQDIGKYILDLEQHILKIEQSGNFFSFGHIILKHKDMFDSNKIPDDRTILHDDKNKQLQHLLSDRIYITQINESENDSYRNAAITTYNAAIALRGQLRETLMTQNVKSMKMEKQSKDLEIEVLPDEVAKKCFQLSKDDVCSTVDSEDSFQSALQEARGTLTHDNNHIEDVQITDNVSVPKNVSNNFQENNNHL